MFFTVFVPALLAAGALAHPRPNRLLHAKRDQQIENFVGDHWEIVDVHVVTETVQPGGPTSQPVVQNKDVQGQPQGSNQDTHPNNVPLSHPAAPSSSSSSAVYSPPEIPSSTYAPPVVVQPTPTPSPTQDSPQASGTDAAPASGTGPASGPSDINPKGGAAWKANVNSKGKSVLATANYWRNKHTPSSGQFTWDDTLAENARQTALTDEKGASDMIHHLYSGSLGQTEAVCSGSDMNGDLTPFENAWLTWICERPNDQVPCNSILAYTQNVYNGDTGHADIIFGSYTKIGCYYQDATNPSLKGYNGIWTCDFS